jgi:hypothetical protein
MRLNVDDAFKRLLDREEVVELAIVIGGELARLRWENEALTQRCSHLTAMVDVAVAAAPAAALVKRASEVALTPHPELAHELSDDPTEMINRAEAGRRYLGIQGHANSFVRKEKRKKGWPQPVHISPKNVAYRQADVKRYLETLSKEDVAKERGNAAMALAQV